ncbi:hypothetical protein HII31_00339 [Pseudocercospora fuligena]|uniref:Uncharacterized protein n=1 Tax=Pseudocercospora fuligena TaxID=685502 RepID=A0A8H6RVF1_9PEZI|nr:hypothetical protein HII31_00339 [Pseudocercospora fuligena]
MDLPRELRDVVYDELLIDIGAASKILCRPLSRDYGPSDKTPNDLAKSAPIPYPDGEANVTLRNVPVASCFTVSHQFSREYQESLKRNHPITMLEMIERNIALLRTPIFTDPDILRHIKHFQLELVVECYDFRMYDFQPAHIARCRCWLQMREQSRRIARNYEALVSGIGSCEIMICVRGPRMMGKESTALLESKLQDLPKMTGVKSIKVLHFPDDLTDDGKDVSHCYEPVSGPYASWTPEEKWMHHDVEAVPWRRTAEGKSVLRERPIWADERSE